MTPAEMKSIQDAHVAAEARKDIQGALAGYREDCYYQNVGLNFRVDGKQRVGVYYQAGWQAFPDGEVTIEGEAFGEDVAVHWGTFRATNEGSFMGVEPTGRKVAIPVISAPWGDEVGAASAARRIQQNQPPVVQVGAGSGDEIALHLRAFTGTQQPVVDEHTGQPVSNGTLH